MLGNKFGDQLCTTVGWYMMSHSMDEQSLEECLYLYSPGFTNDQFACPPFVSVSSGHSTEDAIPK
jgi:hypothetical protein